MVSMVFLCAAMSAAVISGWGAAVAHAQEPCACPFIFLPVCDLSTGTTYSNDCEAVCEGVTEFEFGDCSELPPAPEMEPDMEPGPEPDEGSCVLTGGEVVPNGWSGNDTDFNSCNSCRCGDGLLMCTLMFCLPEDGACVLTGGDLVENGWSGNDSGSNFCNSCTCSDSMLGCTKMACPPPACVCPMIYMPVCGFNGVQYSNECEANCENVFIFTEGECPEEDMNASSDLCVCPAIYAPVCTPDGIQYSNECEALCENEEEFTKGECEVSDPDEELKSCILSNGDTVPSGYAGNGAGADYCNNCVCTDGLLGCTRMLCEPICNLEPETGPGRAAIPQFFHNATSGMCEEFIYGGVGGNPNRFETKIECLQTCTPEICDLEPETGFGRAAFPRFFHNSTSGMCEEFIWGGAEMGSNANNFELKAVCEAVCIPPKERQCVLTGGETVPGGWSGPDTGSNFCNSCTCEFGMLACTLLICPE